MSDKHFINDAIHLVDSALHSATFTNPSIALDSDNKILYVRPDDKPPQVSLVSGGGSGHEPSYSGFVGHGLLSAAVSGTIFASPSAEAIRIALTSRVDTEKGVLTIIMNYTGDVLNFGVASEKAMASGYKVNMVVVGDDVGVGRKRGGKVGRRGIAGTVLVIKIAGALAAMGASLEDVTKVAKLTAKNIVSLGASLDHVHVPGRAPPDPDSKERIENGAVEIGMGIHNEPGSDRATVALPELVKMMLQNLLDQKDEDRAYLSINSNEVVLLINNLGGVSVLELGGITAEVVNQLADDWNIKPVRILSGTYMTSLNGLGFSISILNVVNTDIGGPSMLQLLDSPAEAVGWTASITKETWEKKSTATRKDLAEEVQKITASGLTMDPVIFQSALNAGLGRVIAAESFVTKCDTIVGDGDCGIGLKRGAEAILNMESKGKLTGDIVVDVSRITEVVETSMDGTSGALYAIFLNSLVKALRAQPKGEATPKTWADALIIALQALSKYTPARPGDRTLADALYPFVETLAGTGDLKQAADAAKKGAQKTKGMKASLGRSVYVGGSGFMEVPDPGAWGLCQFFLGLAGVNSELGDAKAGESDYEMI